jgi:VWFA-related protein
VLQGEDSGAQSPTTQKRQSSADGPEEVGAGDIIRVNTTLVTIPVSVLDRDGKYIPNLRKEDFRVWDDSIEQQVAYFASTESPFTVVLMIDTSGSTHFKLDEMQDAAIDFVNQLQPDDRVMVVSFDDKIRFLIEQPTNDHEAMRRAIMRTRTGGSTRLYDAVNEVFNHLNRIQGRKAIVLFTDGVDTTSRNAEYHENIRDAEELDALIYPVQFDTYQDMNVGGSWPGSWPGSRRGPSSSRPSILGNILGGIIIGGGRVRGWPGGGGGWPGGVGGPGTSREDYLFANQYLHALADKTGARVYNADQNLATAFSQVAEELRRQYSLGYYPKSAGQPGERHQIKVRTNRSDLVVRARDSYIYRSPFQCDSTEPAADSASSAQDTSRLLAVSGEPGFSVGDSLCDGNALINRATEAIIPAVTTPVTVKPKSLLRLCLPVRCEITVGISNAMIAPGNSQRGPTVRLAGNAKYNPPTARIAIRAGQRGSGSQRSGTWARLFSHKDYFTPSIRSLTGID